MDDLANSLRELRAERALSQPEAAELVGVSLRQWQRWEHGDVPHQRNIRLIADAFGVKPSSLFGSPDESQLDRIEDSLAAIAAELQVLSARVDAAVQVAQDNGRQVRKIAGWQSRP